MSIYNNNNNLKTILHKLLIIKILLYLQCLTEYVLIVNMNSNFQAY